ncbi:MAG: hypothetical protein WCO06_01350 [Candidatus Roizmanbacteria bacterium]
MPLDVYKRNLNMKHGGRFKKGITPWNKNRKGIFKHSKETKEKIGVALKGRSTKEWCARGENHWAWKGGIYPLIYKLRHCIEYKIWRTDIFKKDNYTCLLCKSTCGNGKKITLNADHYPKTFSKIINENKIETYEQAISCKELWDITNGRTLCYECHRKETSNYQKINWVNQYVKL